MRFEGIHHITCITGDAPGNVDFYVRVLGLRLVKKSVNQDDPTVYHLFYADEKRSERSEGNLRFADPEGLALELSVVESSDEPLIADNPEIPRDLALQGFDGVRAYADPGPSRAFLEETLNFDPHGDSVWEVRGDKHGSWYAYDDPPQEPGVPGAGTVHHVA